MCTGTATGTPRPIPGLPAGIEIAGRCCCSCEAGKKTYIPAALTFPPPAMWMRATIIRRRRCGSFGRNWGLRPVRKTWNFSPSGGARRIRNFPESGSWTGKSRRCICIPVRWLPKHCDCSRKRWSGWNGWIWKYSSSMSARRIRHSACRWTKWIC